MDDMEGIVIGLILACIITAFLPNTSVTAAEWDAATTVCANNSGVKYARGEGSIRSLKVVCNNGVIAHPKVAP